MKRFLLVLISLSMILGSCGVKKQIVETQSTSINPDVELVRGDLPDRLSQLEGVTIVRMEQSELFEAFYELKVTQLIDPENPKIGTFEQRVFLHHRDINAPVVFITEGYQAGYANNPKYSNELTWYLNANQITVEHRYFAESTPEGVDYSHLTVKNAAHDHHHVVELFKQIYKDKWVSTGISKGGQTTLYHRYHYPEDVDASVGYVCPLNFSEEDPRVYEFFKGVATEELRDAMFDYQTELLENKDVYLPMFEEYIKKKEYTFRLSIESVYELCVLEYPFAYLQWGVYKHTPVPIDGSEKTKFSHLMERSGPGYFAEEDYVRLKSFFYQAMTEIGYYGYEMEPFGDLITATKDQTFMFFKPENGAKEYNYQSMKDVDKWVKTEADRMIFIYGEYDPWTATGVEIGSNSKIYKFVQPEGSHLTRIHNMPESIKTQILDLLSDWMGVETKE